MINSNEAKKNCISDWKWMREHCLNMSIYHAKKARVKETGIEVYCWACAVARERSESGLNKPSFEDVCPECPVNWGLDTKWCYSNNSPFAPLQEGELLTYENTTRMIKWLEVNWIS